MKYPSLLNIRIQFGFTIILLFSLLCSQLSAQKSEKDRSERSEVIKNCNDWGYQIQEKVFNTALKYGDIQQAKDALYQMLAIKPENTWLKDSLAVLYFQSGLFTQCILVSTDILQNNPDNVIILEIKAVSEVSLGYIKDAINDYEKLYELSKNVLHLYQLALLQNQLKRYVECNLSIEQLLAHPETGKQKINITAEKGSPQIVPLKAAIWNLKGVVFMGLKEYDQAKTYFSKALKIFPEFELVKENLELIETKLLKK